MKLLLTGSALLSVVAVGVVPFCVQAQGNSFSGNIERVWEDGFRLNTGDRSIVVDSWDVCGDNTVKHLSAGEKVTVNGEFEGGEFDAFSIIKASGESVCS
ncbi:conserved hypothetical protein [Gloeothece citriformis PCC 7424]|uniref:DUF5666 domain-containing protein n=1 Tax=Gloeothece citriformis (strain PCC 7424) TaxID=65393 RepID=B7KDA1_GLOC7|nr:hypothetical protein [Gloeothece citriformis]ACK68921.1 conserved hypothetical protein [Gloeothece citriformis PCC 7424]